MQSENIKCERDTARGDEKSAIDWAGDRPQAISSNKLIALSQNAITL
jgi:hypothetical protein